MTEIPERSPSTLAAIFDSLPDLVVVYDENGRYLDVLTGHQVLSFSSPKELIGYNVRDLLEEETANTILDGIERALATGEVETVEYEVELAGESFWFEGRIAPIEEEVSDGPGRVVFVARDISRRRQQQRELERKNERLEQFASLVSHDLRNPLQVLSGSLDLAEETGDPEAFERCRRSIDRMERMIDDLLVLARQGDRIDDPEAVDLATVASQSWGTAGSGGEIRIETDRTVRADPERLRQLLENLFRNSVEHGSTGSRPEADDSVEHGSTDDRWEGEDAGDTGDTAVTVTVGDLDDGEGFFVADDGPGIPEDERERVMEMGYTTASDGTGFGLAIVRQIADAHEWDVSIAEGATGGTRVEIHTGD